MPHNDHTTADMRRRLYKIMDKYEEYINKCELLDLKDIVSNFDRNKYPNRFNIVNGKFKLNKQ